MKTTKQLDRKKLALFALILATSLTFAACTPASKSTVSTTPETTPPTASTLPTATMPTDLEENAPTDLEKDSLATNSGTTGIVDPKTGVRTVTVEAGSFYYKPDVIRVKAGDKVKLTMNSVDMMHDFNVDELKIKVPVTKSGATASTEFTAPMKPGSYEYYCSVGQHRANGQVGTLIIE